MNCASCGKSLTPDDIPKDNAAVAHCRACIKELLSDEPPKWLRDVYVFKHSKPPKSEPGPSGSAGT